MVGCTKLSMFFLCTNDDTHIDVLGQSSDLYIPLLEDHYFRPEMGNLFNWSQNGSHDQLSDYGKFAAGS